MRSIYLFAGCIFAAFKFGECIDLCEAKNAKGVVYRPPMGEEICLQIKTRTAKIGQSILGFYEADKPGIEVASLAVMAIYGVNVAKINSEIYVRFDPLDKNGLVGPKYIRMVYDRTYDETEIGYLIYRSKFTNLINKEYTARDVLPNSLKKEYCTVEGRLFKDREQRAKLCYRIDTENCTGNYHHTMSAKLIKYVFNFASWYETNFGVNLVLKLEYDTGYSSTIPYKNGEIVTNHAAFLIFNKTEPGRENYVIYDHARSLMVYGYPQWAKVDLVDEPKNRRFLILPKKRIARMCFRVDPLPIPNNTELGIEDNIVNDYSENATAISKMAPVTEDPGPIVDAAPENFEIAPTKTPDLTIILVLPTITTTTTTTTTTQEPVITTTENSTTTTTKNTTTNSTKPTPEIIPINYTKLTKLIESEYVKNQFKPDAPYYIVPGLENRLFGFIIGFMGVMIVALFVGMIYHYQTSHT